MARRNGKIVMVFLFSVLFVIPPLNAKSLSTRGRPLHEFVLEKEDLLRLPPEQQVAYAYLLLTMGYVVEQLDKRRAPVPLEVVHLPTGSVSQFRENCGEGDACTFVSIASAPPWFLRQGQGLERGFLSRLDSWLLPQAEAAFPIALVPFGMGALGRMALPQMGRQLVTTAGQAGKELVTQEVRMLAKEAPQQVGKGFAQSSLGKTVVVGTVGSVALDETAKALANQRTAINEPKPKGLDPVDHNPVPQPPPLPRQSEVKIFERKEGALCIYGGYVSNYKKVGDTFTCARPDAGFKDPQCQGPKKKPKFKCNDFGFSSKAPQESVCVELYAGGGLKNLTERCVEAVLADWGSNGPTGLNPEQYTKFAQSLGDFMKSGGDGFNYYLYCHRDNDGNEKRQEVECKSLKRVVDFAYAKLPSMMTSSPATSAPAGPVAPASGDRSTR